MPKSKSTNVTKPFCCVQSQGSSWLEKVYGSFHSTTLMPSWSLSSFRLFHSFNSFTQMVRGIQCKFRYGGQENLLKNVKNETYTEDVVEDKGFNGACVAATELYNT